MKSIKSLARFAGILYLVIFIVFPLSTAIGRSGIQVSGDVAATAASVAASQSLVRIGLVGESIIFLVEILLGGILYVLLKPVSQSLSLASALSRVAEGIIQSVNAIFTLIVLLLVSGAGYLTVFETDQLNALVQLFLNAYDEGILVWGLFFGFHLLILGYLVFRSGYFPRLLGVLLALAGVGYLLESYGHFLAPQFDEMLATVVLVLAVPGELAFTGWLLWKGIDVEKWQARANEAAAGKGL